MKEQEKLQSEAEAWLNENCKAKDWSEESNQVKDFIHASDVFLYMASFAAKKLEEQRANADVELSDDEIRELAASFYGVLSEDLPPFDKDKGLIFLRACAQYREALKSKLTNTQSNDIK